MRNQSGVTRDTFVISVDSLRTPMVYHYRHSYLISLSNEYSDQTYHLT
jgi:hypothetical protein